jgi:hypothetical protein
MCDKQSAITVAGCGAKPLSQIIVSRFGMGVSKGRHFSSWERACDQGRKPIARNPSVSRVPGTEKQGFHCGPSTSDRRPRRAVIQRTDQFQRRIEVAIR